MSKPENLEFLLSAYPSQKGNKELNAELYNELRERFFKSKEPDIKDCAYKAYLDLSRTLSGIGKNMPEDDKRVYHNDIYELIENSIQELLDNETVTINSFDEWHKSTCEKMCQTSERLSIYLNNEKKFSYGQAQKWLNMTLKYMLVAEQWEKLDVMRSYLHVPVDSYIMENACLDLGVMIIDGRSGELKPYSDYSKPWSTWEYEEYIEFQERIRESLAETKDYECSMDWEFDSWIRIKEQRGM
jgi:hypothetical protein